MFARTVSIRLKPNSVAEFNRTLENEILPLLRKQKGFRDELALVAPNRSEVVAISLWDQKENADAYGRETYPEVLETLGKVVDGTPQVNTHEVSSSTFHKIAAQATCLKPARLLGGGQLRPLFLFSMCKAHVLCPRDHVLDASAHCADKIRRVWQKVRVS